jgi:hypothetical protein
MIQQAQRWLKRQGHDVQVLNVRVNDDDCEWYIEGTFPKDLTEFAADDGDNGGEDDALHKYARMWWAGDEATQMQIERALAKMGWEIGEDEGSYDNGGVFVIRAGDINGDSYQSWAAEDLTEGVWDTVKQIPKKANAWLDSPIKGMNSKHAGHAVQGAMAGMTHGHAVGHAMTDAGVAETALNPANPKDDYTAKRKALQDLEREPGHDAQAVRQRKLDLEKEARAKGVADSDLNEKSTSQAQFRTMAAAAHDPEFARKVGIKPSVAKEFNRADRGQSYKSLPKKA